MCARECVYACMCVKSDLGDQGMCWGSLGVWREMCVCGCVKLYWEGSGMWRLCVGFVFIGCVCAFYVCMCQHMFNDGT